MFVCHALQHACMSRVITVCMSRVTKVCMSRVTTVCMSRVTTVCMSRVTTVCIWNENQLMSQFQFYSILLHLYMFRAHRPIFRRVRTAVHTAIGSVSVSLRSHALYVVACLGDYSLLSRVLDGPQVASFHTLKTIIFILNKPVHARAV